MQINVIAVDIAKNVFQVHGFTGTGERVLVKRLSRRRFMRFFQNQQLGCEVVMEACGTGHYWGRQLRRWGYHGRLIPPQHVRAYVVGNKTDGNDADAIYHASRRRDLRDVPIKTPVQQDVMALHRVRERRKKARVALVNQIRSLLAERGLVCGRGLKPLRGLIQSILDGETASDDLTGYIIEQLRELQAEWTELDEKIAAAERAISAHARDDAPCQLIADIEGVGPITASAIVAAVGDASQFRSARQMAAWLGLTPKEHSSGQTRRLGGITKRGEVYLRTLLIHGARAAARAAPRKNDARSRWVRALAQRRGHNKAVVALANKNARIIWALLRTGECYRPAAAA
jgi:transposase